MAPKKAGAKGRGQPKAGASGPPEAAAEAPLMNALAVETVNSSHLQRVISAVDCMMDNGVLADIDQRGPLAISADGNDSGTIATQLKLFAERHSTSVEMHDFKSEEPYDPAKMAMALGPNGPGKYQCGANAMWVDMIASLTPNVPLVENSIQKALHG